ncbi:MAG: squalene--hopene cyclase [Bryobacterales bacterium]|nr:squalene--hopene cyclase [Bryobacterales bacterium]
MSALGQVVETRVSSINDAIDRATEHLLGLQDAGGYWWGDLTADTTLESDFILLELWLHPPAAGETRWNPPNRRRIDKACRRILSHQLPDGGFNIYSGGPADVSATTKAYFALKLSGYDIDSTPMRAAREKILELGGFQACNSYVKLNLSFFGLYPRQYVPSIPPEMMLVPGGWLYEMSSWTRAIVVPLSVVHASDPQRPVPEGFNLNELFRADTPLSFPKAERLVSWRNFFYGVDAVLKLWDRFGSDKVRKIAVDRAMVWALERTKHSDGLGAIYPPMMYLVMALDLLGYSRDSAEFREALGQFERLMVETDDDLYFQPCFSPVWDTAIAAFGLADAGNASEEALRRAADWLLSKEVRRKGDWSVKRKNTEPSGWYFEFANEFYPDIDDTGMVLMALSRAKATDRLAQRECIDRAVKWLLDMQSSDGGWAAFDVDNNFWPLSYVPFADHNAMLDPTCADITGRVMEALIMCGVDPKHSAIRRGVEYLRKTQEPDGSWYGRWGVNYVYGTCFALRGLRAAGESDREAHMLRAGEWLRSIQNADGGWGECCSSYAANEFVAADSTPTQTSWALMGLISSGDNYSSSVRKGLDFLVSRQLPSGGWDEHLTTGTGFPRVFYLTYHYYRHAFPLMALSCYRNSLGESD